jgi:hypothetical protein
MARCKSCDAEILWVKIHRKDGTESQHPCNPDRLLTLITKDGQVARGLESHFSTCPQAEAWRKPKQ